MDVCMHFAIIVSCVPIDKLIGNVFCLCECAFECHSKQIKREDVSFKRVSRYPNLYTNRTRYPTSTEY